MNLTQIYCPKSFPFFSSRLCQGLISQMRWDWMQSDHIASIKVVPFTYKIMKFNLGFIFNIYVNITIAFHNNIVYNKLNRIIYYVITDLEPVEMWYNRQWSSYALTRLKGFQQMDVIGKNRHFIFCYKGFGRSNGQNMIS